MAERVTQRKTSRSTTSLKGGTSTAPRKAPARTASEPPRRRVSYFLLAGVASYFLILGASIAVGYSDKGQLDVQGIVGQRQREATTPEEQRQIKTLPVQNQANRNNTPHGGLVPTTDSDPQTVAAQERARQQQQAATSSDASATSTEQTATSTDPEPTGEQPAAEDEGA